MTYDTMYGRVELAPDGLYEASSDNDKRFPLSCCRLGSLYLTASGKAERETAAQLFVKVLNGELSKVYVVTDCRSRYEDILPAEQILDVSACADDVMRFSSEMEERYIDLLGAECTHSADYNKTNEQKMQQIFVLVDAIDDYADRLGSAMYPLVRISQKGRAAGINVVACSLDGQIDEFVQALKGNCSACFLADGKA